MIMIMEDKKHGGKRSFEKTYTESPSLPKYLSSTYSPRRAQDIDDKKSGKKIIASLKYAVSHGKADYLKTSNSLYYNLSKNV